MTGQPAPPPVLRHRTDGRDHRVAAYPIAGDALDAIMKGFRALAAQGFDLPAETLAWVERCEAVKARFPKPAPDEPEVEDFVSHDEPSPSED